MSRSKNPKPKALRHPVVEPDLPGDPWMAPWKRREPGPTQLAAYGRGEHRRRRPRPRRVDPEAPTSE